MSGNSFLLTIIIFYDFDPIFICRRFEFTWAWKFKMSLWFNLQPELQKEPFFKCLSASVYLWLNNRRQRSLSCKFMQRKRVKRLSCCALEDERKIWKCTCSMRHYMTLNINFTKLQGREGSKWMLKSTVVTAENSDTASSVKIDALEMLHSPLPFFLLFLLLCRP